MIDQIPLTELLEDDLYRKFFLTVPKLPGGPRLSPPWRLYVRDGRRWLKKDCSTYKEAYKLLKPRLHTSSDAAIVSKGVAFDPPSRLVKIRLRKPEKNAQGQLQTHRIASVPMKMPPGHLWCPYCRRPVVFTFFRQHHAFQGAIIPIDSCTPRCTICGIRQEGVNRR